MAEGLKFEGKSLPQSSIIHSIIVQTMLMCFSRLNVMKLFIHSGKDRHPHSIVGRLMVCSWGKTASLKSGKSTACCILHNFTHHPWPSPMVSLTSVKHRKNTEPHYISCSCTQVHLALCIEEYFFIQSRYRTFLTKGIKLLVHTIKEGKVTFMYSVKKVTLPECATYGGLAHSN